MNVEGAFVGKLDPNTETDCGSGVMPFDQLDEEGPGKGALPFLNFIAVRLLPINGERYKEERYVTNLGLREKNGTDIEDFLGAFVHYVYQESRNLHIFADLQGLSSVRVSNVPT